MACGSTVKEFKYQMRAADEAHTSVWSCGMCPLDPAKIRFSDPGTYSGLSFPRLLHKRSVSEPVFTGSMLVRHCTYVEMFLTEIPASFHHLRPAENIRYPCSLPRDEGKGRIGAHYYTVGAYSGLAVRVSGTRKMSPRCKVQEADVYDVEFPRTPFNAERDGVVREVNLDCGTKAYLYSREVSMRRVHSAVVALTDSTCTTLTRTLVALHSFQQSWPSIRSFVNRDQLANINNTSPRAWDSRRTQRKDAIYSPKVDGERAYVLVYQRVAHMFRKGKGYPQIGWRVLSRDSGIEKPVVIDVENTLSYGTFFIDMLTDSKGDPSPRSRNYQWSVEEFAKVRDRTGMDFIRCKPYYKTLVEAESVASSSLYPTDGVIALWGDNTTARKMKQERSIELLLRQEGTLATSDGDVVIEKAPLPPGLEPGCIVEVRFKLNKDGRSISSSPLFQRVDKVTANSTSAVRSVLASFSSVQRDNETRRRNVLIWCESLKSTLMKDAMKHCGNKKIVLDVGTGTGQSLDILTPDRGISYILVEPDESRCDMLRRRAGVSRVFTDPREILSNVKHLKSGSQTYMVLCCSLDAITSDEQLMSSIHTEIAAVTAFFSAHYVIPDLYEFSSYWHVPVIGCCYPYDGVAVGCSLVDTLDVKMWRQSESECRVRWGGDREYDEPYTTISEYQPFATVIRASEVLQAPSPQLDEDVYSICSKVHVIKSE